MKYRSVDKKTGHVLGGPFYYIERGMGMKWRWLAKLFAFFGMCVGLFGIGTFTQVNSISSAITGFFDPEKNATVSILGMDYSIFTVIGSIVLAVLVGLVVIGGLKRIAKVSERVIPAMVVLYVGLSVLLIVTNLDKIPGAFVTIFESAFGLQAAAGGMLGAIIIAMQKGIARGIFSNEAGLGSAPIAAAAAQTKEPVRQGLVSMTGTFLDTIVVCSMTGLALVMTGAYQIPGLEGAAVTTAAFQAGLPFIPGEVVSFVLMACLVLFGFTTILGWDYYGERCLEYFSNGSMKAVKTYRWLYIAAVLIGPYMTVAAVWTIADIFNGLMALPNMIALIALSGVVVKETKDYFERLQAAGDEDAMEPHLPGDNWDIPPIDPLNATSRKNVGPVHQVRPELEGGAPGIALPAQHRLWHEQPRDVERRIEPQLVGVELRRTAARTFVARLPFVRTVERHRQHLAAPEQIVVAELEGDAGAEEAVRLGGYVGLQRRFQRIVELGVDDHVQRVGAPQRVERR